MCSEMSGETVIKIWEILSANCMANFMKQPLKLWNPQTFQYLWKTEISKNKGSETTVLRQQDLPETVGFILFLFLFETETKDNEYVLEKSPGLKWIVTASNFFLGKKI